MCQYGSTAYKHSWFLQAVCDMLKRALRTLMSNFVSLAYDTSRITLQMFTAAPQASVLDLAKQVTCCLWNGNVYVHSLMIIQGVKG